MGRDNDSRRAKTEAAQEWESGDRPAVAAEATAAANAPGEAIGRPVSYSSNPVARTTARPKGAAELPFTVNDFIRFSRIIASPDKWKPKGIQRVRGAGIVLRISKSRRRIDGELVTTGRVDAGNPLGVVTAILDDAEVLAIQEKLL